MRPSRSTPRQVRAEAEAAAWLARLQSDRRSAATDAGLRAWLDADALHRDAFEKATGIWDMIPGAASLSAESYTPEATGQRAAEHAAASTAPARRFRQFALAAIAAVLATSGVIVWQATRQPHYSVPEGAMQTATLDDGSRVSINTDSDLVVDYDPAMRRVRLDRGEALFEVAHDASRPFVVEAGDERIVAIGTSFVVRNINGHVSVTLIEGRVSVASAARPERDSVILAPGERWSVAASTQPSIDRPSLPAATAWRQGKAIFTDATLADATAEMNRYGGPELIIADPRAAGLHVSGVFDTDNPRAFAEAVSSLHGLKLAQKGGELLLTEGNSPARK